MKSNKNKNTKHRVKRTGHAKAWSDPYESAPSVLVSGFLKGRGEGAEGKEHFQRKLEKVRATGVIQSRGNQEGAE